MGVKRPGHVHDPALNPATCYDYGCRLPDCLVAHNVQLKKVAWRRRKYGPAHVPAKPLCAVLGYARAAGIDLTVVARRAGLHHDAVQRIERGERAEVRRDTAKNVLKAVDRLVDEAFNALEDCRASVKAARMQERGGRRWPTEPLRAVMNGHAGQLGDADRRALYRPTVGDDAAERLADLAGVLPENIWVDWFAE